MFLSFLVPFEDTGHDMVAPVQDGLVHHILQFRQHDPDDPWDSPNDVLIGILSFQTDSNPVFSVLGKGFIKSDAYPDETSLDFFLTVTHYVSQGGEYEERARSYMAQYLNQIKQEFITPELETEIAWSDLPEYETTPILTGENFSISLQ